MTRGTSLVDGAVVDGLEDVVDLDLRLDAPSLQEVPRMAQQAPRMAHGTAGISSSPQLKVPCWWATKPACTCTKNRVQPTPLHLPQGALLLFATT